MASLPLSQKPTVLSLSSPPPPLRPSPPTSSASPSSPLRRLRPLPPYLSSDLSQEPRLTATPSPHSSAPSLFLLPVAKTERHRSCFFFPFGHGSSAPPSTSSASIPLSADVTTVVSVPLFSFFPPHFFALPVAAAFFAVALHRLLPCVHGSPSASVSPSLVDVAAVDHHRCLRFPFFLPSSSLSPLMLPRCSIPSRATPSPSPPPFPLSPFFPPPIVRCQHRLRRREPPLPALPRRAPPPPSSSSILTVNPPLFFVDSAGREMD